LLICVLNDGAPWPLGVVVLICAVMAMLGAMLTVASSR
jgi:hypothetical protein